MDNTDLISVIIPIYNIEEYISRCIDSVVNQTYKNLEIILVDDGSTDNSGKICDEYAAKDSRIKVVHKANGGVSSARNVGLDIAKGNYIGFIDSDDYIELDMYEFLYELLIKNNVDISCCDYFVFNNKQKKYAPNMDNTENGILSFNEILNTKNGHGGFVWNKLYSRKLVENIRFNEELFFGEDFVFMIEAFFKAKKVCFCKDTKYYYFNNWNSITRIKVFKHECLKHIVFYDKLIKYCKNNNLKTGYTKYRTRQLHWVVYFLSLIASENKIENKEDLKFLIKYIKKNLFFLLFGKFTAKSKCFSLLCYINFNLASKIYRMITKLK